MSGISFRNIVLVDTPHHESRIKGCDAGALVDSVTFEAVSVRGAVAGSAVMVEKSPHVDFEVRDAAGGSVAIALRSEKK